MSITLDMMEYVSDALAQAAYVSNASPYRSNADIDDEDMADISDWADADAGGGVSSQVTFDSKSCMKLDSGTGTGLASRQQDIGSFGARTVISFNIYFDALGTRANTDYFYIVIYEGSKRLFISAGTDGLFILNTADSDVEVGTDLIAQDVWQEWTFDVNWTAGTTDVYLDGILKASDVDCGNASTGTEGNVLIYQRGSTTANRISYIDWFKAGSDFISGGGLQSYSEDTIKTQGDYSLKGIGVITDSLNKTLTRTVNPTIDLSDQDVIKMDIRASRTGSNIKIGFHDAGGVTTEHTANVLSADTFQTEDIDISAVANGDKDAIDSIIVTITNADA